MQAGTRPPMAAPGKPRRKQGDYFNMCGRTVGVVLALNESTEPIVDFGDASGIARPLQVYGDEPVICRVVEACCRAQLNEVFVVTTPALSDGVSREVHRARRKKNASPVQVVAVDQWALDDRTQAAATPSLFGYDYGVIELAGGLASTVLDGYDSVLLVQADDVLLTSDSVYEACSKPQTGEAGSLGASDGGSAQRLQSPLVITREAVEAVVGDALS